MAAKIGAVEVLDWIVETMGDQLHLEHAGLDGWTALHAACKAGHVAFVEFGFAFLHVHQCDINATEQSSH